MQKISDKIGICQHFKFQTDRTNELLKLKFYRLLLPLGNLRSFPTRKNNRYWAVKNLFEDYSVLSVEENEYPYRI